LKERKLSDVFIKLMLKYVYNTNKKMKIIKLLSLLFLVCILILSCKNDSNFDTNPISNAEDKAVVDSIEITNHNNNIENTTTLIGNQIWMVKNLDVSTFRNGDTIFEAKSDEDWQKASKLHIPAWCYYDNNIENGKKYGRLYNWYAVMDERGLAPLGFHIPINLEYDMFLSNLGLSRHGNQENKHNVASILKSTSKLWSPIGDRSNGTSTNSSGFSALPSGLRYNEGGFNDINEQGHWWTSENIWHSSYNQVNSNKRNPSELSINYWVSGIGAGSFDAGTGLSVRCIKGEMNRTTKIPILQNEFVELDKDGKPREGTWTFDSYRNSVTKTYINGIENGVRMTYDGYGTLLSRQNYKDGMLNGESNEVNIYGEITESGNYYNGKKVGVWTKYKWTNRRMDGRGATMEIESTENFDENDHKPEEQGSKYTLINK
jgi:uncharacterized protein (TIGR02145 family)